MNRTVRGRLFIISCLVAVSCAERDRAGADVAAAPVDTGRVMVPGSSIYYEAAGQGPPVILLHGGNLDRRMWDSEFEYLRQRNRVIRYDSRGYGRSGRVDTAFAAHNDLLALMDSLSLSRATLIGLSLGGRISIDFALAHPDRVDRLILAGPGISGGKWAEDGDTVWLKDARRAVAEKDSMGLALAWLQSAYIRTALRDSTMASKVRQIVVENASFWMDLIRMNDPEREADPPAAGRLAELRAPILLLVGEEDTPFIQDVARAIAAQAPNVRRIDFPGVGHMVNLEAPDRFREAVLEFLAAPAAR